MGFPWMAAIAGGARGASQGLGGVIDILDKADEKKRSDTRYKDEQDWRQTMLDAELARSGIFPADAAPSTDPATPDKNMLAAGRPSFASFVAARTKGPAPKLFDGVQPSTDAGGFRIVRSALDNAASTPLGLDPTTAGKDLHQAGDPNAPALPNAAPTPRTNIGNSPVHRALSLAATGVEGNPSTTIGGKRYVVDPDNTPEGRRARAQAAKEEQKANAKLAERRSILQQLRRSRPQTYGELSDEMIEAAAADDDVFHQVVLPKDNPFELHVRERQYDIKHPLPSSGDAATPQKRAAYILRRAAILQKPTRGSYGRVVPGMDRATAEATAAEEYDNVTGAAPSDGSEPPARNKNTSKGDIVLPANPPSAKPPLSAADSARAATDPGFKAWLEAKGLL